MNAARIALLTAAVAATSLITGCGDKVPESQAAKKVGAVPKQTLDRSTDDVAKALEQGAQRARQGSD
jgi:hypothetical protein